MASGSRPPNSLPSVTLAYPNIGAKTLKMAKIKALLVFERLGPA